MENKNVPLLIGVALLGLVLGYVIGISQSPYEHRSAPVSDMHGAMGDMMTEKKKKTGDELDKAFLDEMIVHHEGAVQMAQALLVGTKRPELIEMGNNIITAQTGEIEMMKKWRASWFGAMH